MTRPPLNTRMVDKIHLPIFAQFWRLTRELMRKVPQSQRFCDLGARWQEFGAATCEVSRVGDESFAGRTRQNDFKRFWAERGGCFWPFLDELGVTFGLCSSCWVSEASTA